MKPKPILFNTEMVRAILDGRKSVMRRLVKPQLPPKACLRIIHGFRERWGWSFWRDSDIHVMKMPYRPDDILYVRETWSEAFGVYWYRADDDNPYEPGQIPGMIERTIWRPSIHMPKKAARLFLRVTAVLAERLQDISTAGMRREGVVPANETHGKWQRWQQEYMQPAWDSTIKKADLPRYGWDANPWVWVIEFERISKEEEALESEVPGA